MRSKLSRREFLKISAVAMGCLAFTPFTSPENDNDYPSGVIGRIARDSISVYREPSWDSETVGYRFRDDLVNIYYELTPPSGPVYNPLWYRIWGGYIHSGYVQRTRFRFNIPLHNVSKNGQLCEVTVPFTDIYYFNIGDGWQRKNRLYYQTTHWAVGIDEGPDKKSWYRLYDELLEIEYHVPASHLRPIPDEEISPLSPNIPWENKRIEVILQDQVIRALEKDKVVFETQISSGIPNRGPTPNGIPTSTPQGNYNIESKMPSKHMGNGRLTGDNEVYTLPGVPWTSFFVTPPGVAFHGAYWHNNFGIPMSHGCVNMRPEEAKWLFRWSDPKFQLPIKDRSHWEQRGYGTQVHVI
jgi:hypothetical protein